MVTLIHAITTLILPKIMNISEYGYYQLFVFYAGYLGVLHLGWADGIYLRYCGTNARDINRHIIKKQIVMFLALQGLVAIILAIIGIYQPDVNKKSIYYALAIFVVVTNTKTLFIYLLQATSKIIEYAKATMKGNIVYLFLCIVLVCLRVDNFLIYIVVNILSELLIMCFSINKCKDFCYSKNKVRFTKSDFGETKENISSGSKLMLAALASMLIIGSVKLVLENKWGIETFAQISLTLSISNLLMTFINAIATVMLPLLRGMDLSKAIKMYPEVDEILLIVLFGVMVLYYPIYRVTVLWLPHYATSLAYMAILFPICIFESKSSMLVMTYLKLIRKEKSILAINITSVVTSVILTLISAYLLNNMRLTIVNIMLILAFRCILGEIAVRKYLNISVYKSIFTEIVMSISFVISNVVIGKMEGMIVYVEVYLIFLFLKRHNIVLYFKQMKINSE